MRKLKSSLGKVLLKGFKKKAAAGRARTKPSRVTFNFKSPSPRKAKPGGATKSLSVFQFLEKKRQKKIPAVAPVEVQQASALPAPPPASPKEEPSFVQPVQLLLPDFPSGMEMRGMVASELLRPKDRLKQSMDAFILDQRSPHTRLAYEKDLKRFFKYLHARNYQRGPESLDRTLLIAYKEYLVTEKLEHTTIDRHLATLKSFFKWLVEDGILFKSPADGIRFLNPKRLSTTQGFSDEEVKKVLSLPDLHRRTGALHYAVLMILFYCGLRRSELCALKTVNLGTERNQRVIRLRGKGNAERILVMIPPVWNALKHYFFITRRDFREDTYLFKPQRNNRTGDLNKPLDTSMIFYIVTKYARLAGISNRVSPHSCRATAISNARDHHVPDRAIQEFAGWASTDMITRYDKRKTSVEDSAAHSIQYGGENRPMPPLTESFLTEEDPTVS